MTTRREFLATAAVVPAVAVMSPIPPPVMAEVPISTIAPAYPFRWWYTDLGDGFYTEEFDSKEQALAYLKDVGEGWIAECQQQDYHLQVDGDQILEMLMGQNEDLIGEGEFIDPKPEQVDELGRMVSEAISQWTRKNKINCTAWTFGQVRNAIRSTDHEIDHAAR